MNCKYCGAIVNDDDVLCKSCGAKLSKESEMPDAHEVAGNGENAEVNTLKDTDDNDIKKGIDLGKPGNNEGDAAFNADDASGSADLNHSPESEEGGNPTYGNQPELKPVRQKNGLIAALFAGAFVVLALAAYIGLFGGYDTITNFLNNRQPLTYIKDNEFYVKNGSNKPEKISGKIFNDESMIQWIAEDTQYQNYTMLIKQRNNGRFLYFYDNIPQGDKFAANLSLYRLGGKTEKIASGVYLNAAVNKDGTQAMFLKDYNFEKGYGDLYIYKNGDKSIKIAGGVKADAYKFSDDGKTIAYVENSDKSEDKWDLTIQAYDGPKEKVDTGIISIIDVGNAGSTVVYIKPGSKNEAVYDLYLKEKGVKAKCIASEIADIMLDRNNNSFFVLADYDAEKKAGDLYFKELGKDKVKIDDNVLGIIKLGKNKFEPEAQFMGNRTSDVLYFKDCKIDKGSGDLYIKRKDSNKVKVGTDIALSNPIFSNDLRTIAYYRADNENGIMKLFAAYASEDNLSYKEKSVSGKLSNYANLSKTGNLIVYPQRTADELKEELFEMKGDDKSVKISDGIFGTAKISDDGKAVIFEEESNGAYNLYIKKPGKEKTTVVSGLGQSDKLFTYDFKKVYYTKGYDVASYKGDLYEKEEGKSFVMVDSGVSTVLFGE